MQQEPQFRALLKKQERGADGQISIDWINDDLITFVKDRLGHDQRYGIDPSKIKADLGWYPETSFEVGIVKTGTLSTKIGWRPSAVTTISSITKICTATSKADLYCTIEIW